MAWTEGALELEKVIGTTTLSNSCLSTSSPTGDLFYAAGTVVVKYSAHTNKQTSFFHASKPISCLTVSPDGRFLATGERGHQPRVTIWEITTGKELVHLAGHRQGVGCVAFSPDSAHLVSVGFRHDKQLFLWDWPQTKTVALHRLTNKVNAVSWNESGTFFVTCGDRHLKFWTLEYAESSQGAGEILSGVVGKPGSITEQLRDAVFMDVCCGVSGTSSEGLIYCTTSSGVLCAFTEQRLMDKWVQLESAASYCLALFCKAGTPGLLVVGCADGLIRAFSPDSLIYQATLPLPAPLLSCAESLSYAAVYAMARITGTTAAPVPKLAAIYADHSIFVWDIADILNVAQYRSFIAHRACIWDVQFIDQPDPNTTGQQQAVEGKRSTSRLPQGSFATCSADGTVRIWNLDARLQQGCKWRSPYSRDLLHMLELEEDSHEPVKRNPVNPSRQSVNSSISSLGAGSVASIDGPSRIDLSCGLPDPELPSRPQEASNPRALAVHPSGRQLAVGDKTGRLRVYDLAAMKLLMSTPAHAAEILTLNYSPAMSRGRSGAWMIQVPEEDADSEEREPMVLLASAGRDRLVHVFDASHNYTPVTTLDNHSSSITIVKFTSDGRRLISCGGDKTMVFSSVNGPEITRLKSIQTPHGTINGLAVEATNKFAVTSGQDKRLNIWNLQSGKHLRAYRNPAIKQELYRADIDPSGMYVATSAFDKSIYLFDFFSGELVTQVTGHSELVTSVRFSLDGQRLISVGGDGCIMVWRLADLLVKAMRDRLMELYSTAQRRKDLATRRSLSGLGAAAAPGEPRPTPDMLPPSVPNVATGAGVREAPRALPPSAPTAEDVRDKGKWASRLDKDGYEIFGRKISTAPSNQGERNLNKFTLEMNQIELSFDEKDAAAMNAMGSTVLATSIEACDEVRQDVSDLGDDDDDDDGDGMFRPGATDISQDSSEALPITADPEESQYLSDFEAEGDEDLARAGENLDRLEQSALDLESWLEQKLRSDGALDESVETSLGLAGAAGLPPRAADYLVDATTPATDSAAKVGEATKDDARVRQSLSSAFFQNMNLRQDPSSVEAVAGTQMQKAAPSEQACKEAGQQETNGDRLEGKRRETAAAVANMKERLRSMGILKKTIELPGGVLTGGDTAGVGGELSTEGNDDTDDEEVGEAEAAALAMGQAVDAFDRSCPPVGEAQLPELTALPPAPPSPARQTQTQTSSSEKRSDAAGDTLSFSLSFTREMADSTASGHHAEAPPNVDSVSNNGGQESSELESVPSEAQLVNKIAEYKSVLSQLALAKEAALRSYDELLGLRASLQSSHTLLPAASALGDVTRLNDSVLSEGEQQSASDASALLPPPHPAASANMTSQEWRRARQALDETESILGEFRESLALDLQASSANVTAPLRGRPRAPLSDAQARELDQSTSGIRGRPAASNTSGSLSASMLTSSLAPDGEASMDATVGIILERYSDRLLDLVSDKLAARLSQSQSQSQQQQK